MLEKQIVINLADLMAIINQAAKGDDWNFMRDMVDGEKKVVSIAFFNPKTHFKTKEVLLYELSPETPQNANIEPTEPIVEPEEESQEEEYGFYNEIVDPNGNPNYTYDIDRLEKDLAKEFNDDEF